VTIVACGPCPNVGGTLVYAIMMTQPVQQWTVVRSHSDFSALYDALKGSVAAVSTHVFPVLEETANTSDIEIVANSRNGLQEWLSAVLLYPSTIEVPEVRNFLTVGANTIPTQYCNVSWTWMQQFSPPTSQSITANSQSHDIQSQSSNHHTHEMHSFANSDNLDDMEMADMFPLTDDEINSAPIHDDQDYDDEIPPASVRYKQTEEPVTEDDELELMSDVVEMIDDIGSLAQSLGASHLGRSLKLQAALNHSKYKNFDEKPTCTTNPLAQPQQQGLNIGRIPSVSQQQTSPRGGIASVLEQAANNNVAHFNHRPPTSAPRLDSFRIIKVIGKGSFGM
jgi:PX domain